MKISINTPMARIEANLQEDQVKDLLRIALEHATGGPQKCTLAMKDLFKEAASDHQPDNPAPMVTFVGERPRPISTKPGYFGFLYIKCEECGTTKGICVKAPITEHRCNCGHVTPLEDMKQMFVKCKCGERFKYRTNITDRVTSMDCKSCGAPVDLEYHEKNGTYETIE